jgi:hypothetical protein
MTGQDLYVRITKANGKSHVQHFRVWDGMRFMESLQRQHREAKDPNDRCVVTFASVEDYRAARKAA